MGLNLTAKNVGYSFIIRKVKVYATICNFIGYFGYSICHYSCLISLKVIYFSADFYDFIEIGIYYTNILSISAFLYRLQVSNSVFHFLKSPYILFYSSIGMAWDIRYLIPNFFIL